MINGDEMFKRQLILVTTMLGIVTPCMLYPQTVVQYTNINTVNVLALEGEYLWSGTDGGLVRWTKGTEEFVKFTTADGLADNQVLDIAIEPGGVKWIATDDGVSRFDGEGWTTYGVSDGLPRQSVRSVLASPDGTLWFGTSGGLCRRTGAEWTVFTTDHGLPSNTVNDMAMDSTGILWIATGAGVASFDGSEWSLYSGDISPGNSYVYSVTVDCTNTKWFGTQSRGLYKFTGGFWTNLNENSGIISNMIRSIATDPYGRFWCGGMGGANYFDGFEFKEYTLENSPVGNFINSIVVDNNRTAYYGDSRRGITARTLTASWQYYYLRESGPVSNRILDITHKGSDIVWLATDGGVTRFSPQGWITYTSEDGLAGNYIRSVAADHRGLIWFGLMDGLINSFDNLVVWNKYNLEAEGTDNIIADILPDRAGRLWFSTNRGIQMFDGSAWHKYLFTDGTINIFVRGAAIDSHDKLWFATGNGVNSFDGTTWGLYRATHGLADNDVYSVAVGPDDNVWFGTTKGVSRFDGTSWTNYDTTNGLADNFVNAAAADPMTGFLWFGTNKGLSIFDGIAWQSFTQDRGLSDNDVNSISFDSLGNAWIGTESGASMIPAGTVTDIRETPSVPRLFSLHQNFPNPFNPSTTIRYELPKASRVRLVIYNILGQEIRTLLHADASPGLHEIAWDGRNNGNLPATSGVYFYRLETSEFAEARKMLLIR